MRFVDLDELGFPSGWEERARRALQDITALEESQRSSEIKNKSQIWAELKSSLGELSRKKCWYCETKQERSDMQVDHFRPKSRVGEEGCENHPGYWWLAFEWENLRYSCTYCNSIRRDAETDMTGGKADRFPLRDEAERCWTPDDSLPEEQPVLLDPTVRTDPDLLWFDEDGSAHPKYLENAAPWPYRRARESIDIYHLNHSDLKEARQAICNTCTKTIIEGDWALKEAIQGSGEAKGQFQRALDGLKELIAENAKYSAAARATVMGLRGENRPWLNSLLEEESEQTETSVH